MAAQDGQDELLLLERVFLRIGSADTDEQLESTLGKFLCPVLLKLASQKDGVRKKVMELLVHINKRVKSRPKIQLPVKDLLAQYVDPDSSPFITNFTILYIKMGYPRLPAADQASMLPQLMQCIDGKPEPQQTSLLQLIVPALQHLEIPSSPSKKTELFQVIIEKPAIQKLLLHYMMDTMFLPYSYASHVDKGTAIQTTSATGVNNPAAENSEGATSSTEPKFTGPPPAMSESALKKVTGDKPPSADELERIKLAVLKVLGADIFPETEIVCLFIVGTSDARHSVVNASDRELKRIIGGLDMNKSTINAKLFSIFQGTVIVKGKQSLVKPADKRTPASIQMRLKIFPFFLKSREAANLFPSCVQIVFDCLYGANTNAKLKIMAVQFVHHLCFNCSDAKFKPIGPVLLSGMVKLIGDTKEDSKLRSLAYVAVGKIARRAPQLVTKDIALLQTFFNAMCLEDSENKMAVQEALSMMSESFKSIDSTNQKLLEALIMENIEKPHPQNRLMAVQYANAVFPRDHIPSRYVLLLACGDLKDDIYEEASKGLRTLSSYTEYSVKDDTPTEEEPMPHFTDMVNYIHERATERLKTSRKYVTGNHVLPFNPVTFGKILMYLRMCLAFNAGVVPNLESMEAMKEQAPPMAKYVRQLLADRPDDKGPISVYIGIIRQLLTAFPGAPAMYCMLEIVAIARDRLAPQFIKHLDWIKTFMFSSREEMRIYAAELYALVVATAETPERHTKIIKELTDNIKTQALEGQHGSVLCLGYLLGYLYAKERRVKEDPNRVVIEDMEVEENQEKKIADAVARASAVTKISTLLDHSQSMMVLASTTALSEVGRCGVLPLLSESGDKDKVSKLSIVNNLLDKVKCQKDSLNPKIREKAALCLGCLCVGEENFPHRKKIIEGLLNSAAAKQFELHLTVGEALVTAAEGIASPFARDVWLQTEEMYQKPTDGSNEEIRNLLHLLLGTNTKSPNPHIRQAACVWLVALVRRCGNISTIQKNLKQIQSAFMGLLSENDEMTQDIASKGLGIVYEKCSKEQKEELVSMLVETLTTGKKTVQQNVTEDTEVFQEGSIGKTPDGQNLSTYKELCSIANDLNQPDLIYKFMHLANHNASWNNKKGAAFGFGTIAAQAGEQLAPFLHKIVPKLYRYQFDPNPRIQQAMTSIWNALVSDNKKTVDKFLKEILNDLLLNLTSNQWRVRESSCIALHDLLRGRPLDDIVDQLPQLWEICFRVRDDIKESVRNAADVALKSLSRACIKICDLNYGKVGEQAISLVLPCLLKSGLGSTVQEVRAIALSAIVKIAKNAGPLLKPHIPLLVVALLESLSTLEPQYLNYVALHAASNQATQEKIDSARIAATKTSPMMEVVNMCVQHVDEAVLAELVPRMSELIRSGIGLGTKVGCANIFISLTHQCPKDLGPYAGKILGSLLNGLSDRNVTVRKTNASAIGHIVKVAKDSSVEKLISRLKVWYMEKEEEAIREACGITLNAIGHRNPDVLKRHGALALPLLFLAMHAKEDSEQNAAEKTNSVWEETWLDATPGTEAGIRLYLTEIVEITTLGLESQSWLMKAQAASAMSTVANKLSSNLTSPHLGMLLSALVKGLGGRTWTGKETLLEAISTVCTSCMESILVPTENQPTIEEIILVITKEAKKENLKYKMEALKCLSKILDKYDLDRFKDVTEIIYPLINKAETKDDKEEASGHDINQDTWLLYKTSFYESLCTSWPKSHRTQEAFQKDYCQFLCGSLAVNVWRIEVEVLKGLNQFFSRLAILEDSNRITHNLEIVQTMLCSCIPPLCQVLGSVKYSSLRTEAIAVTEVIVKRLTDAQKLNVLDKKLHILLKESLGNMSQNSSPEIQERAANIVKALNCAKT